MKKASMNLAPLTVDELIKLRQQLEVELANKISRERERLESEIRALAVLQGAGPARAAGRARRSRNARSAKKVSPLKGVRAKPKYRGPGGETWAGRGLPPRWLSALEKKGKKRETFLIQPANS
jgi:DNA-binding protein H-NS